MDSEKELGGSSAGNIVSGSTCKALWASSSSGFAKSSDVTLMS